MKPRNPYRVIQKTYGQDAIVLSEHRSEDAARKRVEKFERAMTDQGYRNPMSSAMVAAKVEEWDGDEWQEVED